MNKLLSYTDYILALADGTITEEIRQDYLASLPESEKGITFYGKLLALLADLVSRKGLTPAQALTTAQEEYTRCGLEETLGSYPRYAALAQVGMEAIGTDEDDPLTLCKQLVAAADQTEDPLARVGVYYAVVDFLVTGFLVLRDTDFTKQVTDFVRQADLTQPGVDHYRLFVETALFFNHSET